MRTEYNKQFPAIEWDRDDLTERHGHTVHYNALGESEDGRTWLATGIETNGEDVEITDVVQTCPECLQEVDPKDLDECNGLCLQCFPAVRTDE